MRKLTTLTIAIAALGVIWMIAEEVSIYLYLNAPCLTPCDKVVGGSLVPSGVVLIIAAAIIFVAGSIIWPSKTTTPSSVN